MQRLFIGLLLSAVLAFSGLALASAEESKQEKATSAEHEKGGHDSHEKSASPLAPHADLAIWTVVVFAVLFIVLRTAAWKPMLEGLQKREANIRSAVEDAEKARNEAKRMREDLQAELARANEKVRDIMDEARRDAQHTTEEMVAKAKSEIQGERDRLHRELQTARDQALQELWNQTAQLATLVSAKAIRRHLTPEDHRRLVDETLADFRAAGDQQRAMAGV